MSNSLWTQEELEAMRLADEEIEQEFTERFVAVDEAQKDMDAWLDELAVMDLMDHESYRRRKMRKKYSAAYYEAHREEIAAYQAAYYEAHREEIAAYQAAYREAHREEIAAYQAAYQAAYYEAHREEIAAYQAAYYEAHREERKAYLRERRKKKKQIAALAAEG